MYGGEADAAIGPWSNENGLKELTHVPAMRCGQAPCKKAIAIPFAKPSGQPFLPRGSLQARQRVAKPIHHGIHPKKGSLQWQVYSDLRAMTEYSASARVADPQRTLDICQVTDGGGERVLVYAQRARSAADPNLGTWR
jgi:hypothetical protein